MAPATVSSDGPMVSLRAVWIPESALTLPAASVAVAVALIVPSARALRSTGTFQTPESLAAAVVVESVRITV